MTLKDAKEILRAAGVELEGRWASANKMEKGLAMFFIGMGVLIPIFGKGPVSGKVAGMLLYLAAGGVMAFSKPATYNQVVVMSSGEHATLTAQLVVQAMDAYFRAKAREHVNT